MAELRPWCRVVLVRPDGSRAGTWALARSALAAGDASPPRLDAVDALARQLLWAGRHDLRLVVEEISPGLRDLLDLVGLAVAADGTLDAHADDPEGSVEMEGQAEGREQPLGFERGQEEGHLGDPAV